MKKNIFISFVISIIVSFIVLAGTLFILNNLNSEKDNDNIKLSDFKISNFNLDTEKTNYNSDYIDDSITYEGTGRVTCKDTKHNYFVLFKVEDEANKKTYNTFVDVIEGVGEITTYDSTNLEEIKKPDYEFEILGFLQFEK